MSRRFPPPFLPVVAGGVVSWDITWPRPDGLVWGLCGSGAWALLCAGTAITGVRLGWWPTLVPSKRRPRLMLLAMSGIAAIGVWLVCGRLGAPPELLTRGRLAPLLAALVLACTWVGNISLHTSAAAASVTLITLQLGRGWGALYLLVAAIAWSRLHLRAHTLAQVLAGAVLSTAVCAATVCLEG
ncbi:phosphatase PAP2 family protein [Streptomyces sp. NPDC093982]|uniref:phosphatase PAP2 family protein n=1 Tax=Streptomyces sp. NPDC093982 TaxID=3155077 RepID=UPI003434D0FF